jgi:hypothetical protein
VLDALAALGPFFAVGSHPAGTEPRPPRRPVSELSRQPAPPAPPARLARRITSARKIPLGTPPRDSWRAAGCNSFADTLQNFPCVLLMTFIPWPAVNLTD